MGELTRRCPKPMIRLAGKPILEHQIELARRYGHTDILMLTGYRGNVIEDYFGSGEAWGVQIGYHREEKPLGTGGAIKAVEERIGGDFLVFYGDVLMDLDLHALAARHAQRKPLATLVVHPNNHPQDSDLVETDAEGRVTAFHAARRPPHCCHRNLANAALYALSPEILRHIPAATACDLGRDVFPAVVRSGGLIAAYNTPEYLRDVGTEERLREVEADVTSGKVARLNRRNARKAVFLDRDGVLNVERGHVTTPEQLQLVPGAAEAVRRINRSEYLAVVVSNQSAIAKGLISEQQLERIHARLDTLLGVEGAYLDRIYYCPHHPERGFPGERPEYKIACTCRKPAPGMLLRGAAELNIDLAASFMIGDQATDILAGGSASVKTILLRTGHGATHSKYVCLPDFVFDGLTQAVDFVLGGYERLSRAPAG